MSKCDRLGIERIDSDPYNRGYWLRFDALPRPADTEEAKGWDDCDEEIAFEADPDGWMRAREEARRADFEQRYFPTTPTGGTDAG